MTNPGCSSSMTRSIINMSVSASTYKSSVGKPRRSARSFVCLSDSSPEIYSTFLPLWAKWALTCSKIVDFPIPGSPPTKTSDPGTIPPPSTRSNSRLFVCTRVSSCETTFAKRSGFNCRDELCTNAAPRLAFFSSTNSSTSVFHSLQPGQRPIHLADSYPHDWQTYFVLILAISSLPV